MNPLIGLPQAAKSYGEQKILFTTQAQRHKDELSFAQPIRNSRFMTFALSVSLG